MITNGRYSTYVDGKFVEVMTVDEICTSIKERINSANKTAQWALDEKRKLEDEKWKDSELQEMKKRLNKMREECRRGFPISEEESKKISQWKKDHIEKKHGGLLKAGAIGGAFSYIFTPSAIGVFGSCRCTCGEEFDFRMGD